MKYLLMVQRPANKYKENIEINYRSRHNIQQIFQNI